jgi:hypothetical protein
MFVPVHSRLVYGPDAGRTVLGQTILDFKPPFLSLLFHLGNGTDKNSIERFPFARYAAQWDSSSIWTINMDLVDYPFRKHMFEVLTTIRGCPVKLRHVVWFS